MAALSLTAVAACGGPTTSTSPNSTGPNTGPVAADSVALKGLTATGAVDLKTAPKVAVGPTPISSTQVERKVLTPGTGVAATAKDTVSVRAQIFNGTSGKLLDDGFSTSRQVEGFRLSRQDLVPGFVKGLVGSQKGARVAFTIPPKDAFGSAGNDQLGIKGTDTIVVVADVANVHTPLTQLDGPQKPSPAGLPTVEFKSGPTSDPTITVPKTAPPTDTQAATLVEGKGATITKGQTLTAHYQGVLWRDGSVFDSSWKRGTPMDRPIGVQALVPAWDNVLVGKKVGSRMLLVVPPKDGYGAQGQGEVKGTDTMVFVIDILDAY